MRSLALEWVPSFTDLEDNSATVNFQVVKPLKPGYIIICRYVQHQRLWFLSYIGLKQGINFSHFGRKYIVGIFVLSGYKLDTLYVGFEVDMYLDGSDLK